MLLTNFFDWDLPIYKEATKVYGDKTLYIDKNAYGRNGVKLEGQYALRTNMSKDRSDFWELFRSIQKKKGNYIHLNDKKGQPIFENSVIGLRLLDSSVYTDKVRPQYNLENHCYEFISIINKSTFKPNEYNKYLCIDDLYGWGSTFEVIE
jgi:hypothetical protein